MWQYHWLMVLSLMQIVGAVVVYALTKVASQADATIQQWHRRHPDQRTGIEFE